MAEPTDIRKTIKMIMNNFIHIYSTLFTIHNFIMTT